MPGDSIVTRLFDVQYLGPNGNEQLKRFSVIKEIVIPGFPSIYPQGFILEIPVVRLKVPDKSLQFKVGEVSRLEGPMNELHEYSIHK